MPIHKQSPQDRRPDGTMKGLGFLGALLRPDGGVSTELSMGTSDVDGVEREIPLLVPTLTEQEVSYLLSAPPGDWQNPTLKRIAAKAVDFARTRQQQGAPFFAGPDEQYPVLPRLPRVAVQGLDGDVALPNESGQRDPRLPKLGTLRNFGR